MKWENLRADQMKAAVEKSGGLCIFPIGCLEKHGYHLPLGTDSIKVQSVVEKAAEIEDVMIFPTGMWLGDMIGSKSNHVENNHGAISLTPQTLLAVVEELLDEIARNGFRKILIVNSHGGNSAIISLLMRTHFNKKRDYTLMSTSCSNSLLKDPAKLYAHFTENSKDYPMLGENEFAVLKKFADLGKWGGGHADFVETALVMGDHPELVEPKHFAVANGLSLKKTTYLKSLEVSIAGGWTVDHPHAYNGYDPIGCNQAIGEAFLLCRARSLAEVIRELKADEKCVEIQRALYNRTESPV